MIKIGITGSLASGKSTASKIISKNNGPLFSADKEVKDLYKNKSFRNKIAKALKLKRSKNLKKEIKNKAINKKLNFKTLEKIIHPLVRKKMHLFLKKNKKKKKIFLEIPLLVESKLTKHFDVVIFIKSRTDVRRKRYIKKGGNLEIFRLLDKQQLKDTVKMKVCDHVVINNKSLSSLKKKLFNIIKLYV